MPGLAKRLGRNVEATAVVSDLQHKLAIVNGDMDHHLGGASVFEGIGD